MGNCYTLCRRPIIRSSRGLGNVIRIAKSDGKILEYRAPILVRDVLGTFADYGGVGISKETSPHESLPPDYELKVGNLYYLLPSSAATFPHVCHQKKQIKVTITKQQLQELLSKTETLPLEELLSVCAGFESIDQKGAWEGVDSPTSWRPKLETIPEQAEGCEQSCPEKLTLMYDFIHR